MLQQSVWISPWYTVVDYDMSTIVRTSNNDMLSIYITHLRLVNGNYRIRCKRTRIDAFPRPCPIRSTFPIYFRILRLLKRYHIAFFFNKSISEKVVCLHRDASLSYCRNAFRNCQFHRTAICRKLSSLRKDRRRNREFLSLYSVTR